MTAIPFLGVMLCAVLAEGGEAPGWTLAGEGSERGWQPTFLAKSARHTASIVLRGAPEEVFPLFGPVREKEWVEGWEPEVVYPLGAEAVEGMVFKTREAAGTGEKETVWMLVRLDASQHEITYVRVTPESNVARIDIVFRPEGGGVTRAHVSYSVTGISPAGNLVVEAFTAETFTNKMAWWEKAINHRLKTGQLLKRR